MPVFNIQGSYMGRWIDPEEGEQAELMTRVSIYKAVFS